MSATHKLCFVIYGDWLTKHVRCLWADEGRPEYALKTLQAAFPEMNEGLMIQILTGSKKMIGNSSDGMNVVNDNSTTSSFGNSLSTTDIFQKMLDEIKEQRSKRETLGPLNDWQGNIKDDETFEPPKPEYKIGYLHGWLSPDGKFYKCEYFEHIHMADRLGYEQKQLEKLGWIKWSVGKPCYLEKRATQKQIDMVWDWCQSRKEEMPEWLLEED